MQENEKKKKKFRLPHWLPFVLSLMGVAALMILYVMFIANWLGNSVSPQEKLTEFAEYAKSVKSDIIALSKFETAKYGTEDRLTYFITKNGDEQKLRDAVFVDGAYNAESYFSTLTGNRCSRYYYTWYDLECLIICDSGGAVHTDGSQYTADIGDGVTAAIRGYEKE